VAGLAEAEAKAMGYAFKDETGGSYSVRNSVFNGAPTDKLQAMCRESGAQLLIDDGTVILVSEGAAREGNAVLVSPETGLVGYPTFNENGVVFSVLFNPEIRQGGLVKVESVVPKATGTWKVTDVNHKISSSDKWATEVKAEYAGGE
jgi:hypothetical protein